MSMLGDRLIYNREYIKFFFGQFFAHTADAMMQIILIAYISLFFHPAGTKIAEVFFVFLFPQFVFSSMAGIVSDKINRKFILTVSNLFRAGIVFFITYLSSVSNLQNYEKNFVYIYISAFLLGLGYAFYYAAKMSIIKDIVSSRQLKTANSLNTGVINFLNIAGVAFAGIYILKVNLNTTITIAGVFYALALCSFALIKYKNKSKNKYQKEQFNKKLLSYVSTHKKIAGTIAVSGVLSITSAMFFNIINFLTVDMYYTGLGGLVYFRIIVGLGILIGIIASIYVFKMFKIQRIQALGFLILTLCLYFSSLYQSIKTAFIPLIFLGCSLTLLLVSIDTILMKITSEKKRGRIFGLQLTCNTICFLSGTFLMSKLPLIIDVILIMKSLSILCFMTFTALIYKNLVAPKCKKC